MENIQKEIDNLKKDAITKTKIANFFGFSFTTIIIIFSLWVVVSLFNLIVFDNWKEKDIPEIRYGCTLIDKWNGVFTFFYDYTFVYFGKGIYLHGLDVNETKALRGYADCLKEEIDNYNKNLNQWIK